MTRLGRALSIRTRLPLWYGGVLLAIVLVISAVSYFLLRRTPIGGADVELLMVGQIVRDAGIGEARRSETEIREILGTRFLDVFYRVIGPDGRTQAESGALRGRRLLIGRTALGRPAIRTGRAMRDVETDIAVKAIERA